MMISTARVMAWLAQARAANDSVADEAVMANLRRLRWLVLIIIPLNLLFAAVNWWEVRDLGPGPTASRQLVGSAHLCMAVWLAVAGLGAYRFSRQSVPDRWARVLHGAALIGFLLFSVVVALLQQDARADVSPFLRGCVFVSLFFLMRPLTALVLFVVAYLALFAGMAAMQTDAMQLLTYQANGLAAAVIGLVLSQVLWHKNTVYVLLQRELQSRNTALLKQQEELVWLARRDALTGLYNRGEFLRLAEEELRRARRHGTDTSAIMLDLDHFKRINDNYGHPAGDSVLRHAAGLLLAGVRGTDVVARVGGEEFMILLPHTSLKAARLLAEKLLRTLRESPARLTSDLEIPVTASLGVSTLPAGQTATLTWLYAAADHALYEAKQLGRNRVEVTAPDSSLTPSDFQRMRRQ